MGWWLAARGDCRGWRGVLTRSVAAAGRCYGARDGVVTHAGFFSLGFRWSVDFGFGTHAYAMSGGGEGFAEIEFFEGCGFGLPLNFFVGKAFHVGTDFGVGNSDELVVEGTALPDGREACEDCVAVDDH